MCHASRTRELAAAGQISSRTGPDDESHPGASWITKPRVPVAGRGEPAQDIRYNATIKSSAPREQVLALMHHTDTVAEIHNTLRQANRVTLQECTVL